MACDASYLECNDLSPNSCTQCSSGVYLYADQGTCVTSCPDGYFIKGTSCERCDQSCLTCSAGGSTACNSCAPGTYKYQGQCLSKCLDQTYSDYSNQVRSTGLFLSENTCIQDPIVALLCSDAEYLDSSTCKPLDSTCAQCSGPANTNCIGCNAMQLLSWEPVLRTAPLAHSSVML